MQVHNSEQRANERAERSRLHNCVCICEKESNKSGEVRKSSQSSQPLNAKDSLATCLLLNRLSSLDGLSVNLGLSNILRVAVTMSPRR